MPDKVSFNKELEIIEVESFGEVTGLDISNSIQQIKEIQQDSGVDRLLVDTTRQQTLPSPIEIVEIFSAYPRNLKTALLVDASQATVDDVEFVETVAVNRGKNIQLHYDREKALRWLNS